MEESNVEKRLVTKVRAIGGRCLKWSSPGTRGVPDRIVVLPGGIVAFAECKTTGKKPRPDQVNQINMLRDLGFKVEVIDSVEGVDRFIDELQAT